MTNVSVPDQDRACIWNDRLRWFLHPLSSASFSMEEAMSPIAQRWRVETNEHRDDPSMIQYQHLEGLVVEAYRLAK